MAIRGTLLKVFLFCCAISASSALGDVHVRFEQSGLIPDQEVLLTDDSPDTCAEFISDNMKIPRHTKFRIEFAHNITENLKVTLVGSNMGCGHDLYVSDLSAAETEKWTGRWTSCRLRGILKYADRDQCIYDCKFRESYEEVQVLKRPKTARESSWRLCYIGITAENLEISGCSENLTKPSGIYFIRSPSSTYDIVRKDVYCDMDSDGGGWTVVLRRQDGSVSFLRDWNEYKFGFGSLTGEFWAGVEFLHQMTTEARLNTLRVYLINYVESHIWVKYSNFSVESESQNYEVHVSGYDNNSTAGNVFRSDCPFVMNKNMGWWYCNGIQIVQLTGCYGYSPPIDLIGIRWADPWALHMYARYAFMMIRP